MPVALLGSTPRGAGTKNATTKRGGGAKKGVSTATVQAKLNARKGLNLFGFGRKKDLNGKVHDFTLHERREGMRGYISVSQK